MAEEGESPESDLVISIPNVKYVLQSSTYLIGARLIKSISFLDCSCSTHLLRD